MACFIYSKIERNVLENERTIQTMHFKHFEYFIDFISPSAAQRNIQIN